MGAGFMNIATEQNSLAERMKEKFTEYRTITVRC